MRRAIPVVVVIVAALASCGDTPPVATPRRPTPAVDHAAVGRSRRPTSPSTTAAVSTTSANSAGPSTHDDHCDDNEQHDHPDQHAVRDSRSPMRRVRAWADTHSTYPATDIFNNGCGGAIVSPVNGVLLDVRRVNAYDPAVDNPATRGGRSVSILGDDGVRYYLAHFDVDRRVARAGRDGSEPGDVPRHDRDHRSVVGLSRALRDLPPVSRPGVVGPAWRRLAVSISRRLAQRWTGESRRRGSGLRCRDSPAPVQRPPTIRPQPMRDRGLFTAMASTMMVRCATDVTDDGW